MKSGIPSYSPLQLLNHYFTLVNIYSVPNGSPVGKTTVDQHVGFQPVEGQPSQWNLQLQIKMASADANQPFIYQIEVHAYGTVEISGDVPQDNREQIAIINGLSLLYGACREMIINVTARSIYGPISIPSLNFTKVLQEAQQYQLEQQAQLAERQKSVSAG